jgi:hypothetical protein
MKKTIVFAVVFALWAFATALSQPAGALRPSNKKLPILAGAGANPQVVALLERSCQNCHSSNTEWPLYGRVYPMTPLLERDIRMARSHMNLSRWAEYDESRKRLLRRDWSGSAERKYAAAPVRTVASGGQAHPG